MVIDEEKFIEEVDKKSIEIRTTEISFSIGEIISMYKEDELVLNPKFQRMYRWDDDKKAKLIESIYIGIPIPYFYVYLNENNQYAVIDGLQRLSTILEFVSDDDGKAILDKKEKQLESLNINFKNLLEFNDFKWNELTLKLKREFRKSRLNFIVIDRVSASKSKYELFQRLNTGGEKLEPQEIRNCIMIMFDEKLYDLIFKLSSLQMFKNISPISDLKEKNAYRDELVTWFIGVFLNTKNSFLTQIPSKKNTKELLDMLIGDNYCDILKFAKEIEEYFSDFVETMNKGEISFKKYRYNKQSEEEIEQGELSLTVFLGLSHLFVNSKIQEQSIDLEDIKEIKEICKQKKTGARSSGFFPILIGEINKYLDAKSKS